MRRLAERILLLFLTGVVHAEDAEFLTMPEAERREWIIKQAAEYEVRHQADDSILRLEEPVLRFNDNVSGVVDAILFVWTSNGRPEVSASFWYRKDGLKAHEFVSLSRGRIRAKRNQAVEWATDAPGAVFKRVPKAPVPGKLPTARLTQMRQIARRCEAKEETRSGDLQLRLMPQPMMRYKPAAENIVDGAIFSFVKGTNPEVVLLIEVVTDGTGENHFEYAAVRMTSRACSLAMDQEDVWSVEKDPGNVLTGGYRNIYGR